MLVAINGVMLGARHRRKLIENLCSGPLRVDLGL